MKPLCQSNLAESQFGREKPCGRVMIEVGKTMMQAIPVYACPRCDAAAEMPSRKEAR